MKIRDATAAFPAGTPDEKVQVASVDVEPKPITVPVTPSYVHEIS